MARSIQQTHPPPKKNRKIKKESAGWVKYRDRIRRFAANWCRFISLPTPCSIFTRAIIFFFFSERPFVTSIKFLVTKFTADAVTVCYLLPRAFDRQMRCRIIFVSEDAPRGKVSTVLPRRRILRASFPVFISAWRSNRLTCPRRLPVSSRIYFLVFFVYRYLQFLLGNYVRTGVSA